MPGKSRGVGENEKIVLLFNKYTKERMCSEYPFFFSKPKKTAWEPIMAKGIYSKSHRLPALCRKLRF